MEKQEPREVVMNKEIKTTRMAVTIKDIEFAAALRCRNHHQLRLQVNTVTSSISNNSLSRHRSQLYHISLPFTFTLVSYLLLNTKQKLEGKKRAKGPWLDSSKTRAFQAYFGRSTPSLTFITFINSIIIIRATLKACVLVLIPSFTSSLTSLGLKDITIEKTSTRKGRSKTFRVTHSSPSTELILDILGSTISRLRSILLQRDRQGREAAVLDRANEEVPVPR
ncbi:hypothetical protein PIB30_021141 [Stylosanthes scabra]|uniref:Uncharacterized protein n=1 Tax=Stylosanthes scabra TaxID=79078 RepID=A0ABU6R921_9FABA|nr:hypothetical protein [Stylosanthes scabra]